MDNFGSSPAERAWIDVPHSITPLLSAVPGLDRDFESLDRIG